MKYNLLFVFRQQSNTIRYIERKNKIFKYPLTKPIFCGIIIGQQKISGCGGTGIRARFRFLCSQGHAGSIPVTRTMLSVHNASELWTLSFSIYSTYLIFVCRGAGSVSLLVFCQAVTVLGRYSTATPRRVSSLRRSFFGPAGISSAPMNL